MEPINDLKEAARALASGHLVAFPTETVYGLGADATNPAAVARIYATKQRPTDHPLIVHIDRFERINSWAIEIPDYAKDLAKAFWPGPMTLILQRSETAKDFITGGQPTVGIRIPNHPVALGLLSEFAALGGLGVAAPSANRFGKLSPTTAKAVLTELSDRLGVEDKILDGGASEVGIESTIIDCTKELPSILRPGAVTAEMISAVTGLRVSEPDWSIRVSGALEKHYAPNAMIELDTRPKQGEGFLALSHEATPPGVIRLGAPVDTAEFAKILYDSLRKADELRLAKVVVLVPNGDELAVAIEDRLRKAAAR